jgi:Homeodomain-like domain-containing protein
MIKYVVHLGSTERDHLLRLVITGRAASAKLLRARILLKADVAAGERRWTDTDMAAASDTSASTVHRVRQAWVEQGLEAA